MQRDQQPLARIDLLLPSASRTETRARAVWTNPAALSLTKLDVVAVFQTEGAIEFVAFKLWVPLSGMLGFFS